MGRLRASLTAFVAGLVLAACSAALPLAPRPLAPAPGVTPPPVATPAPATPRGGLVVVYGDSLVAEALPYLNLLGEAAGSIDVHTWGGTAICDWFPDMFSTLPRRRPAVVVLAFSGNALTRCMETPTGVPLQGAAYIAKYRQDTEAAVAIARASGAQVVIAATPRGRHDMNNSHWGDLTRVYRELGTGRQDVSFVDAGALIAPHERFTPTMPCLPSERAIVDPGGSHQCRDNRIIVRAPDGTHFCPVGRPANQGVTEGCPVYSSGAFRYAAALVDAARL
jgi:hypothetical protein